MASRGDKPYAAFGTVAVLAAAGLTLAFTHKRRRPVYTRQEWEDALQPDGTIAGFEGIAQQIVQRGIDPNIRADVWPFLLEVFDHASTYAQRQHHHYIMTSQYQQLLLQCQSYEAVLKESLRPPSPPQASHPAAVTQQAAAVGSAWQELNSSGNSKLQQQGAALHQQQQQQPHPQLQQQLPEQVRQFAEAHRIIVIDSVRTDFQKHAAALQLLAEPPPGSSANSSSGSFSYTSTEYAKSIGVAAVAAVSQGLSSSLSTLQQLQQHWLGSWLGGQAAMWGHTQAQWVSEAAQLVLDSSTHLPDDSKRQAARMVAMLSAYALHDPDTGYCQGMSDLLLPFLLLMDDDATAFWCFVSLMQHMGARHNFAVDERGIFGQLRLLGQVLDACDRPLFYQLKHMGAAECHFAYRMVVVMMRRDMPMPKVLQLWEVLWAHAWKQRHSTAGRLQQSPAAVAAAAEAKAGLKQAAAASPETNAAGSEDGSAAQLLDLSAAECMTSSPAGKGDGSTPGGSELDRLSLQQHPHLELFICFVAAVVHLQRRTLLDHCHDADDVLSLFHSVRRIDLWQCLDKAHQLLACLQKG